MAPVDNLDSQRRAEFADMRKYFRKGAHTIWYGSGADFSYWNASITTKFRYDSTCTETDT
jgi:hypothetical protein